MGKKKQPEGHFERGYGKAGWVYVARNNMHRDDIFKVGYTEKTPEQRVKSLNTEQRNRTSQIGFFSLHYACAVLDAQGCEQELFSRLGRLLEHERKEFVNAPLEVIVGELMYIQKKDNAKVRSTAICQHCKQVMSFCPLPQAIQPCPNCAQWFATNSDASPTWALGTGMRRRNYKPKPVVFEEHSPLAIAFIKLQSAVKNYAHEGIWTDDEFIAEVDGLVSMEVPQDREIADSKPVPEPKRYVRKRSTQPKSRKGWMDCPDCLSSIELFAGEKPECLECDWKAKDKWELKECGK